MTALALQARTNEGKEVAVKALSLKSMIGECTTGFFKVHTFERLFSLSNHARWQ